MTRTWPTVFFVVFSGLISATAAVAPEKKLVENKGKEFIRFRFRGRRSVEMTIDRDGAATVLFSDSHRPDNRETLRVNADELAALDALVASTGFFALPEGAAHKGLHVTRHLRVTSRGRSRELVYGHLPELSPLDGTLWKIVHQGIVLHNLRLREDVHAALGAASPHLAAAKVLDPRVLEGPLRAMAKTTLDRGKLRGALEASAWLLTEEQWLGYLWSLLRDANAERTTLLLEVLSSHPFHDDIPKSHVAPVCILITVHLRADIEAFAELGERRRMALRQGARLLGNRRHKEAVPLLVKMLQLAPQERSTASTALFGMGGAAIEPVERMLDHPDEAVRKSAAGIFGDMLSQSVNQRGPGALPKHEREAILTRLRQTTAPKLRKLAEEAQKPETREAAKRALAWIEKGWHKFD